MIKIYGNSDSGNCLKVRWTAERTAIAFEWIELDSFAAYPGVSGNQSGGTGARRRIG